MTTTTTTRPATRSRRLRRLTTLASYACPSLPEAEITAYFAHAPTVDLEALADAWREHLRTQFRADLARLRRAAR